MNEMPGDYRHRVAVLVGACTDQDLTPVPARLVVESADDRTEVDLAADARLFSAEPARPAPTLSGEELAVDKVLAVFGRAEARDFHDLIAVESRYGLDRLCKLAAETDRGFTPAALACSPSRVLCPRAGG